MEDFRAFIEDMGLVDVPCGGRFTWFKGNGKAMSRLRIYLVSKGLCDDWEVVDQRVGRRDI